MLLKEAEGDDYRVETAVAYPHEKQHRAIIAVGSYRVGLGFGIYVSFDGQRLFEGRQGDERLGIDLRRAMGIVTLQMARQHLI